MKKLPTLSGQDAIKIFEKLGYQRDRQRGSHIILRHSSPPFRRLIIPDHRELVEGDASRALIREAGLTVEEFRALV